MSAAHRLPAIAKTALLTGTLALLAPTLLRRLITPHLPTSLTTKVPVPRWLLLLLALPLLSTLVPKWHLRVLRALAHQIYLSRTPMSPPDLFAPTVLRTWTAASECDYNLHKSNSTYFSDADVARAHHVGALVRTGLRRLNAGDVEGLEGVQGKGGYIIALAGVGCTFRKEIAPWARYEVWTRLLAWDEKWVYVVSHFVKPGAVRPKGFALQPWKRRKGSKDAAEGAEKEEDKDELRRAVFATSIAKYVCKKGRQTVPPEVVLGRSRLLPDGPKPAGLGSGVGGGDAAPPLGGPEGGAVEVLADLAGAVEGPEVPSGKALTWERIEEIRRRGLRYAEMFEGLAGLHDEFGREAREGAGRKGLEEDVLGVYGEVFY